MMQTTKTTTCKMHPSSMWNELFTTSHPLAEVGYKGDDAWLAKQFAHVRPAKGDTIQ